MRTHIDWARGRCELALAGSQKSIEAAAASGTDANALSYALTWDMYLAALERDPDHLQATASRLAAFAEQTGGVFWGLISKWAIGTADVLRRNAPAGLPMITLGIDGLRATGAWQHIPFNKLSHAEALYLTGDLQGALAVLEESWDIIERTAQRAYEPEMHRWRGIVLQAMSRDAEAVAAFDTAIAVANGQGSVVWRDRARKNRSLLDG